MSDNITLLSYSSESDKYDNIRRIMDSVDPLESKTEIIYSPTDGLPDRKISKESLDSINKLYKSYNEKYGLELKFDGESITRSFGNILEPNNLKIFEIYLSEAYGRIRVILYQKIMIHIIQLIDDITKTNDDDVPLENKYIMTEKLFEYLQMINKVYDEIKVDNPEVELNRLSSEINSGDAQNINYQDPSVRKVIDKLSNTILKEESTNTEEDE